MIVRVSRGLTTSLRTYFVCQAIAESCEWVGIDVGSLFDGSVAFFNNLKIYKHKAYKHRAYKLKAYEDVVSHVGNHMCAVEHVDTSAMEPVICASC